MVQGARAQNHDFYDQCSEEIDQEHFELNIVHQISQASVLSFIFTKYIYLAKIYMNSCNFLNLPLTFTKIQLFHGSNQRN